MRDHDELRLVLELVQHPHVATDVGIVERCIHFVQEAERRWLGEEDAEQQRECHQGSLPAGQEVNALGPLAPRAGVNLDVAVEREFRILQPEVALTAAEERHEDLAEVLAHLEEGREKELACRGIDLANGQLQLGLRFREVVALSGEEVEAFHLFLVLLDGQWVHRSEFLEFVAQLLGFTAQHVVVHVDRVEAGQEIFQRTAPLRLQAFANGGTASGQFGEAQFGGVQRRVVVVRVAPRRR